MRDADTKGMIFLFSKVTGKRLLSKKTKIVLIAFFILIAFISLVFVEKLRLIIIS